jgi:hypothetical protein
VRGAVHQVVSHDDEIALCALGSWLGSNGYMTMAVGIQVQKTTRE